MRTELRATQLNIRPGEPTNLDVEVTNTADVIDGVTVVLEGMNPGWVELPVPVMSLFPGATASFPVRLNVPTSCLAGDYLVIVRVVSTVEPARFSTNELWVTVEPTVAADLELRPSMVTGGSRAEFGAVVVNNGNRAFAVAVNVEDDARQLEISVEPPVLDVPAGEYRTATLYVKGPRPWFGTTATRSLVVSTAVEGIELREIGTFVQKPRIPRGLLTFAILAGIIALWATIFLLVVNRLNASDKPAKAVPASFNARGASSVPLSVVAGGVGGLVTAPDGAGLARVTVDVTRVKPDGTFVPTASAATGDDGAYTLVNLLPGTYILRFSAEGFPQRWYTNATSQDAATQVQIVPQKTLPLAPMVLPGSPGGFQGSIVVPEGADPNDVTVTVKAQDAAAGDTGVPAQISPTTDPTQVKFSVGGLPTPGNYVISIDSGALQPVTLEEALAGGETKVLNTVQLGAAPGTIRGKVTAAGGVPLGGVNVVVRSAGVEQQTVTPTSGDVGTFVVTNLPTPRAYTITFSAPGFGSQTITLDLLAGRTEEVAVTMLGGTGKVTGKVTAADGRPLGGVSVKVTNGTLTAEGATLTAPSGAVPEGGFIVDGLPTPGTFTITYSLAGFQNETRRVVFLGPGSQDGMDAVLTPATTFISGTVTASSSPLAEVKVELTDGVTPLVSASAASPPGKYLFTNVAPGAYVVTFSKPQLATKAYLITVVAGQPVTLDVDLTGP